MKAQEKVLNLIFPQVCGICGKLDQNCLCPKCNLLLKKEAKFEIQKYNHEIFEKHYYIFKYEKLARQVIIDYKFNEKSYLYKTLVNFLRNNKKFFQNFERYDTIIPVPVSKKRMKQRGYNQSKLIAKEMAKYIGIDCVCDCLIKKIDNKPQSTLDKEQRMLNPIGVYKLKNGYNLKEKEILLIDDIYTTGSTVRECCKIISKGKPKKIDIFTIAKD